MKIETRNVVKKIDQREILKDISVALVHGVNVFIGPNGAGKTTLLKILALLDSPTEGEVLYDGKSASCLTSGQKTEIRRKIGFVFQNPLFLNDSVLKNLTYAIKIRGLTPNKEKIEQTLFKTGLLDKINTDVRFLSGGEKQKLQVARVLLFDTTLLFLDEPTANLDPLSSKELENLIKTLATSEKTLVLSTHNLTQARGFSKKIFFLKEGSIIQQGAPDEIFLRPVSVDVAEFSLSENVIYGEVLLEGGESYLVSEGLRINVVSGFVGAAAGIIRPEDIILSKTPIESSTRNCFKGVIKHIEPAWPICSIVADCSGVFITSVVTKRSVVSMALKVGDEIYLTFKATSVHVLERRMASSPSKV